MPSQPSGCMEQRHLGDAAPAKPWQCCYHHGRGQWGAPTHGKSQEQVPTQERHLTPQACCSFSAGEALPSSIKDTVNSRSITALKYDNPT